MNAVLGCMVGDIQNSVRWICQRHPLHRHLAVLMCSAILGTGPAVARTLHVPGDYPTIQAAIDAAAAGDEVLVMPGTYAGAGNKNLDPHQKALSIRSSGGAAVTTIDCEGSGRGFVLYGALTRATIVEGFTITNGDGSNDPTGGGAMVIGGGSPTIRRCVFRANRAVSANASGGGGGIVCYGGSPWIEDCVFVQNSVTPAGGAVGGGLASHEATPVIQRCRFVENLAMGSGGGGGGIYVHLIAPEPQVIIDGCEFTRNEGSVCGGAALTGAKITACTVENNIADVTGGIWALASEVRNCTISGNVGRSYGGGVELFGGYMADCLVVNNIADWGGGVWSNGPSLVEGCVIADNVANLGGGGLLVWPGRESNTIRRCTFARNRSPQGSGLMFKGAQPPTVEHYLENSIVVSSQWGQAVEWSGYATVMISCTDLHGNEGGDWVGQLAEQAGIRGNFAADPQFCDGGNGDFTLRANSPCLPENHPQGANCGLIGALDEGCGAVTVEATSWGRIKARYQAP